MKNMNAFRTDVLSLDQMTQVAGGMGNTTAYGCERTPGDNGSVRVDACDAKDCPAKKDPSILNPTPESIQGGVEAGPVKVEGGKKKG